MVNLSKKEMSTINGAISNNDAKTILLLLYNSKIFPDILTEEKIEDYTGVKPLNLLRTFEKYNLVNTEFDVEAEKTYYILNEGIFEQVAEQSDFYDKYFEWYKIPPKINLNNQILEIEDIVKKIYYSRTKQKKYGNYSTKILKLFLKFSCAYCSLIGYQVRNSNQDILLRSGSRYLLHISTYQAAKSFEDNLAHIIKEHIRYNRYWQKDEIYTLYIVPIIEDDMRKVIWDVDIPIKIIDLLNFLYWINFFNIDKNNEKRTNGDRDYPNEEKSKILQFLPFWLEYDNLQNTGILDFESFIDVLDQKTDIISGKNP